MKTFVGILVVLTASLACAAAATDKVVCYYGSWSVYRTGNGKFGVENINPQLCTHAIYTFVTISTTGGIVIRDHNNEITNSGFAKFNNLRQQNPKLKTLVAIGGWNDESSVYSNVIKTASTRATFVNNIVAFTKQYNFDGFDLDWEYPAQRGGAAIDKSNYILLLKELRAKFDANGWLLTAAVGATQYFIDSSYNVPEMAKYLDFINVMTYDLHGSWDGVTGQNAPLYKSSKDTASNQKLNVQSCIQDWIKAGAPASKIVLGMGLYGRTYTLTNSANNGLGAPTSGAGTGGPYTAEAGYLGYNEICEYQKSGTWAVTFDNEQYVPFMTKGNQWVGYDDVKSITAKAQFAKDNGLGGAMVWSIETDDFRGICGPAYPLLRAINSVLFGSGTEIVAPTSAPTTTTTTTTTTTKAPATAATTTTTKAPSTGGEFACTSAGYFRDPVDCSVFYQCTAAGGKAYKFTCQSGLYFDPNIQACNYKAQVPCP